MPAPAPGRFLHSHRMAIGRLQQPIGPLEPLSTQEQREADSWAALSPQLQEFSAGLFDGKQRLFLRMFAFDSGLCLRQPWTDFQSPLEACRWHLRPSAAELLAFTRRFLGLFMINRFDILMFLEDAGLWVDRGGGRRLLSDSGEEEDWDEDDEEDGDAAERKYAPATFEAAGAAVSGLLRLLAGGGFYAADDLAPGLLMAQQAEVELPRCALLGAYLPGPLNIVKDVLLAKAGSDDMQPPCLEEVEAGLVDKYQHIAPHFNFRRACAAVLATDLRVDRSEGRRMRVVEVSDRRRVVFQEAVACDIAAAAGAAGPPAELDRIEVEMDPEIGALLLPGMTVTGHFSALSDGSWYFSQPGYVWPSYYYNARSRSIAPPDGFLSEPDTSDEEDYEY